MVCFFFNNTAPTEIYTLSLHDALPISPRMRYASRTCPSGPKRIADAPPRPGVTSGTSELETRIQPPSGVAYVACPSGNCGRSEEHTSELQSRQYFVCRLLLEKNQHDR